MKRNALLCITALGLLCLLSQCRTKDNGWTAEEPVPSPPEYSDSTQWYISDRGSEADVFYIISTETGDYTLDGVEYHHADTYNDSLRTPLYSEMLGVDTLVSGRLNFFSPYYRQCSLQSFLTDSLTEARLPLAVDDARRAFLYYLNNLNHGRPFILAGFSQGAKIILQLIQEMDDRTYRRMIAAYAIGTSITQEMVDNNPRLIAAQGADDTGCVICYNSVRDTSCATGISQDNVIAINPVNWRTDATPAVFATQPSPLLPVDQQQKDNLKVRLDPQTKLLLVEGYTATDYVLPLIGKEGNYHSREIWLYRDHLRDNMALRASKMTKK